MPRLDDHRRPKKKPPEEPQLPYTTSDRAKLFAKTWRTEVASSISAMLATLVTHPLDSIKTRMQAYNISSMRVCIAETRKMEGLIGLYRGVVPPLISYTLVRTWNLSIYQTFKYRFDEQIFKISGVSPLIHANAMGAKPNFWTVSCFGAAGAMTGGVISIAACPLELAKMGKQLSGMVDSARGEKLDTALGRSYRDQGTMKAAWELYKRRGFTGLYSGFHLHFVRDVIGTSVFFASYESVKQLLANSRGKPPDSPFAGALAGFTCGMLSWICVYPIDTVKTQYQRNCLFMVDGYKKQYETIQWFKRDQYRGLAISITRSALVNMIMMMSFEYIKKRIRGLEIGAHGLRRGLDDDD